MYMICAIAIVIGFLLWNERTSAIRSRCVGNYCFILSEYTNGEILSQTDAQQWCRNNGSQLAEIVSQDVQDAVEIFIRSLFLNTNGWYIRTNGLRSSGNWNRLSGGALDSITILEQGNDEFYAYLGSSGTSFDIYAARATDTNRAGYICTDNSACSDGMRMADGQCYRSYTQTRLSWYDARNQCLNRGGDLASFDYIISNDGFRNLNTSWLNIYVSYWIGIRRDWWTWQGSNSDVKYSNWQQGLPGTANGDNCVTLYGGYSNYPPFKWWPHGCNDATPFLCLSDPKTATTRSSSSTVLSPHSTPGSAEATKYSTLSTTFIDASALPGSSPSNSTNGPSETNEPSSVDGAVIGIGVGVGVGGFVLGVVVVVVAIILKKKYHFQRKVQLKGQTEAKLIRLKKQTAINSGNPQQLNLMLTSNSMRQGKVLRSTSSFKRTTI